MTATGLNAFAQIHRLGRLYPWSPLFRRVPLAPLASAVPSACFAGWLITRTPRIAAPFLDEYSRPEQQQFKAAARSFGPLPGTLHSQRYHRPANRQRMERDMKIVVIGGSG